MKRLICGGVIGFAVLISPAPAEDNSAAWLTGLKQADQIYWDAFNRCDLKAMSLQYTHDIEFFHDQVGLLKGVAKVTGAHKHAICDFHTLKLRRQAVPGTVRYIPLRSSNAVYGALIEGQSEFYASENGAPEKLEGTDRFTHLFLLRKGKWRLARIYAHQDSGVQ